MICPNCQSKREHVLDKRDRENKRIYRRRECLDCRFRWTTWELYDADLKEIESVVEKQISKNGNKIIERFLNDELPKLRPDDLGFYNFERENFEQFLRDYHRFTRTYEYIPRTNLRSKA